MTDKTSPDEIAIPVWVKRGMMNVRRDCLDHDDPDHTYNYIKNELGLVPEEYGYMHPLAKMYEGWSREALISEITALQNLIMLYEEQGVPFHSGWQQMTNPKKPKF